MVEQFDASFSLVQIVCVNFQLLKPLFTSINVFSCSRISKFCIVGKTRYRNKRYLSKLFIEARLSYNKLVMLKLKIFFKIIIYFADTQYTV